MTRHGDKGRAQLLQMDRQASYAMNHLASPGRGGHWPAMQAAETVFACRQEAAELFHVDDPEQVVLTWHPADWEASTISGTPRLRHRAAIS